MRELQSYLDSAIEAARLGGRVLMENLAEKGDMSVSKKQEFDFVTEVDLLSERTIVSYLQTQYPEHGILAEESGSRSADRHYQWVVDPLDGTKNFIHGFPAFAVSVALLRGQDVLVGAVLDPLRDELFSASRGGGAFLNGQPIQVSDTADFAGCLLATGFPFRAKHLVDPYFASFIGLFQEVSDIRRAGSAALDLAYCACGRLDGFWEVGLNLWDIAAGVLLISEAGGRVSGFFADDHLDTGNIIASNGLIHERIQGPVRRAFQGVTFE